VTMIIRLLRIVGIRLWIRLRRDGALMSFNFEGLHLISSMRGLHAVLNDNLGKFEMGGDLYDRGCPSRCI
jgi:hypothetical protein